MPLRKHQYKDMDKYYATRRAQIRRYLKRTGSGKYPPRSWTKEEDERVVAHSIPDRELGKQIERSVSAIIGRRHKLKVKALKEQQERKSNHD